MRRAVAVLLIGLVSGVALSGCNLNVNAKSDFGTANVSGFVSSVQLTSMSGPTGSVIQITIVTLQQTGNLTTNNFCGNQITQFPMGSFVSVNFSPGTNCNTLVAVVVG